MEILLLFLIVCVPLLLIALYASYKERQEKHNSI
jgi:uncharacterized membrane protein YozB (DUF420 family)